MVVPKNAIEFNIDAEIEDYEMNVVENENGNVVDEHHEPLSAKLLRKARESSQRKVSSLLQG